MSSVIKQEIQLKKHQSGVVLVIGLIMLLLMTLIGVTAMSVNGLEEKMTGNYRDRNIAFQAAEATLLEAEKFILAKNVDATVYTGSGGLLNLTDSEPTNFFKITWSDTNSVKTSNSFASQFGLTQNPRYIIKRISQNGSVNYFRITARAVGRSPGTQIILQEVYARTN